MNPYDDYAAFLIGVFGALGLHLYCAGAAYLDAGLLTGSTLGDLTATLYFLFFNDNVSFRAMLIGPCFS